MAMLAEPRRKIKLAKDPNNLNWSNDDDKFGQRMLERMGWQKGKGLGANEDGKVDHITVKLKSDNVGVGSSKKHADNWIAHQDDFNSLLANLNVDHSNTDSGMNTPDVEKVISLERQSKSAKGRVHYKKFTRSKDLSAKNSEDLDCVFGRRKTKTPKKTLSEENTNEADKEKDSNYGVTTTTSKQSVQEYFAQKMADLKRSRDTEESEGSGNTMFGGVTGMSSELGVRFENIDEEYGSSALDQPVPDGSDSLEKSEDENERTKKRTTVVEGSIEGEDSRNLDNNADSNDIEPSKKKRKKGKTRKSLVIKVTVNVGSDVVKTEKKRKRQKGGKKGEIVDEIGEGNVKVDNDVPNANEKKSKKRKKKGKKGVVVDNGSEGVEGDGADGGKAKKKKKGNDSGEGNVESAVVKGEGKAKKKKGGKNAEDLKTDDGRADAKKSGKRKHEETESKKDDVAPVKKRKKSKKGKKVLQNPKTSNAMPAVDTVAQYKGPKRDYFNKRTGEQVPFGKLGWVGFKGSNLLDISGYRLAPLPVVASGVETNIVPVQKVPEPKKRKRTRTRKATKAKTGVIKTGRPSPKVKGSKKSPAKTPVAGKTSANKTGRPSPKVKGLKKSPTKNPVVGITSASKSGRPSPKVKGSKKSSAKNPVVGKTIASKAGSPLPKVKGSKKKAAQTHVKGKKEVKTSGSSSAKVKVSKISAAQSSVKGKKGVKTPGSPSAKATGLKKSAPAPVKGKEWRKKMQKRNARRRVNKRNAKVSKTPSTDKKQSAKSK